MAAYNGWGPSLTGQGEPEQMKGALASADLFRVLRAEPALGRAFTAEEDRPGAPRVAVISHGLWQRRFGADPSAGGGGGPRRRDGGVGAAPPRPAGSEQPRQPLPERRGAAQRRSHD